MGAAFSADVIRLSGALACTAFRNSCSIPTRRSREGFHRALWRHARRTCRWRGAPTVRAPGSHESALARCIGMLDSAEGPHPSADVAVIGAGPAGLATAGCKCCIRLLSVVVTDGRAFSAQAAHMRIENYLGSPTGTGAAGAPTPRQQKFGAAAPSIPVLCRTLPQEVRHRRSPRLACRQADARCTAARVIIATGAPHRCLDRANLESDGRPLVRGTGPLPLEARLCALSARQFRAVRPLVFRSGHAAKVCPLVRGPGCLLVRQRATRLDSHATATSSCAHGPTIARPADASSNGSAVGALAESR